MNPLNRRTIRTAILAALLVAIVAAVALAVFSTRAGATEARDCSTQQSGVFVERWYIGPDGVKVAEMSSLAVKPGDTFTVHTKLRHGCELTPNFVIFHSTAFSRWNPAELRQPKISAVELSDDGAVKVTVPASPDPELCKVQIDHALHRGLDAVTATSRYNEPSIDHDGDGLADGKGINRLIGATYAGGECAPVITTTTQPDPGSTTSTTEPEPTTSTSTPASSTSTSTTVTEPEPTSTTQPEPEATTSTSTPDSSTSTTQPDSGAASSTTSEPTRVSVGTPIPYVTASTTVGVAWPGGSLPHTGSNSGAMARFGAIVLAAGALAAIAARRLRYTG